MRPIAHTMLGILAASLAAINLSHQSPGILALSVIALALSLALMTKPDFYTLLGVGALAALSSGIAGYSFATEQLWLHGPVTLLFLIPPLVATAGVGLALWSRTERVWPLEVMVLSNPHTGKLTAVPGPDRVLLSAMAQPLARLPRSPFEIAVVLEGVNTQPADSPLGMVSRDIKLLTAELVFRLKPGGHARIFALTNAGTVFHDAAAFVERPMPQAMLDHNFWAFAWRRELQRVVAQALREEVHASGLSPLDVSTRRGEIAARVRERVAARANALDLELQELRIVRVEPDEAEASLRNREALLTAQGRAVEIELAGQVITDLMRQMAEQLSLHQHELPVQLLETLLYSVMPNQPIITRVRNEVHGAPAIPPLEERVLGAAQRGRGPNPWSN